MTDPKKWALKLLQLSGTTAKADETHPTTMQIFLNQLLDSVIVGGIAGFSAYVAVGPTAGLKVLAIAFGLAFLVKLKEYRKIGD